MTNSNADLGRLAYDAYAEFVGHKSMHGEPLWGWDHLPDHIAEAWMCAAIAVKTVVTIEERAPSESGTKR